MDLAARLSDELGTEIPVTVVLDVPTLGDLIREIGKAGPVAGSGRPVTT